MSVREALVPMYYGDPREALHLARRAQDLAGRTPNAAAAMAPIVEARALGMLVNGGAATPPAAPSARWPAARPSSASSARTRWPTPRSATPSASSPSTSGDTYTNLGDHRSADESLRGALTLYPASEELDRTLIWLDRASCRLQEGEPEEALRTAQETVLALSPGHRPTSSPTVPASSSAPSSPSTARPRRPGVPRGRSPHRRVTVAADAKQT